MRLLYVDVNAHVHELHLGLRENASTISVEIHVHIQGSSKTIDLIPTARLFQNINKGL